MNLENKKQVAIIIFAAGLGLITAFLTSQYVKSSIEQQTRLLAEEFQKRAGAPAASSQEMEMIKREIVSMSQRQQELDQQQNQLRELQGELKLAQEQAAALAMQPRTVEDPPPPVVEKVPVFSLRTPRGKRAVTVLIDALSAVGGLVNPGDTVDVIVQLSIPKGIKADADKDVVTTVLFQNLQVLAVNTQFEPIQTRDSYAEQQMSMGLNVTLALSPEEAALLTFAQTNGKLQLALRSHGERGTENLDIASWETLAEYVEDSQGTALKIPTRKSSGSIVEGDTEEIQPFVQVFRGGLEL
jgi:Flp pilus assembly protein CpaB